MSKTEVTTVANTYISKAVEFVKGENAEQKMLAVQKQMTAGFNMQLSSLEGTRIDLELNVDKAKANVEKALFNNGKEVTDRVGSVQAFVNAKAALEAAENALVAHDKLVEWLEEGLEFVK